MKKSAFSAFNNICFGVFEATENIEKKQTCHCISLKMCHLVSCSDLQGKMTSHTQIRAIIHFPHLSTHSVT